MFLQLGLLLTCWMPTPLLAQGTIDKWGSLLPGSTDTPLQSGFVQLSAGESFGLGLQGNGTIVSWGSNAGYVGSDTPTGSSYTQVAAGDVHAVALRTDGSIQSWGDDLTGQVSYSPPGLGFTQVAAGNRHSLALRADGSILSWGFDYQGQVTDTPPGNFIQVAGGENYSLAVRADGTVVGWGQDFDGQASGGPSAAGFIQVAAGRRHSLALHSDGSLVSWGRDAFGVVSGTPAGNDYVQVSAGYDFSMALRSDGSLVLWGYDYFDLVIAGAPTGTGYTQVAAGRFWAMALSAYNGGQPFCFADTSGGCPCGGIGQPHAGCINGIGQGALLTGSGYASISDDTFQLHIDGVPAGISGLVFRGKTRVNAGAGNPAGNGLLCVAGQTARSQVLTTSSFGMATLADVWGQPLGAWTYGPGQTVKYQYWYRDLGNYHCGDWGYNFSNGWTVLWTL